jgi:hypothetical protein
VSLCLASIRIAMQFESASEYSTPIFGHVSRQEPPHGTHLCSKQALFLMEANLNELEKAFGNDKDIPRPHIYIGGDITISKQIIEPHSKLLLLAIGAHNSGPVSSSKFG